MRPSSYVRNGAIITALTTNYYLIQLMRGQCGGGVELSISGQVMR